MTFGHEKKKKRKEPKDPNTQELSTKIFNCMCNTILPLPNNERVPKPVIVGPGKIKHKPRGHQVPGRCSLRTQSIIILIKIF